MPVPDTRSDATDPDQRTRFGFSNSGAVPFGDADSLTRAARSRLAAGDFATAFALADRRCRLLVPAAADLFLRALAHRGAGRAQAAQRDLAAALALDPSDAAIDRAALAWGDAESRAEAAARIVGRPGEGPLRRKAVEALFEAGAPLAHRLDRGPAGVSGWIAWVAAGPLRVELPGAPEPQAFLVEPDPDHALSGPGLFAADLSIETPDGERLTLSLHTPDGAVERVAPIAAPQPRPKLARSPPAAATTAFLTIVVPVYEDLEATRACLDALAAAPPALAHRIVVVDDCSPNAALKAYLDEAAARGAFALIRNEVNLGFAAAVNRALAGRAQGDALLLNADTLVPPGAIDRLAALGRANPGVGTLTPLSNNGELTSYPRRNAQNALPAPAEVAALDARAARANGDALVDLPNGIGFCLYIMESCLDAVGGLPEVYAQGYFEDVEFCLAARERGFRNVAAAGVYVGHAGSKSFGAGKRALVARNLALIEARFPGLKLENRRLRRARSATALSGRARRALDSGRRDRARRLRTRRGGGARAAPRGTAASAKP